MQQYIRGIHVMGSFKQDDKRVVGLVDKIREVSNLRWIVLFRTMDMHEFEARCTISMAHQFVVKAGYPDELVRKIKSLHCLHENPEITAETTYKSRDGGPLVIEYVSVEGKCPDCGLKLGQTHRPHDETTVDDWIEAMRERIAMIATQNQEAIRVAARRQPSRIYTEDSNE